MNYLYMARVHYTDIYQERQDIKGGSTKSEKVKLK